MQALCKSEPVTISASPVLLRCREEVGSTQEAGQMAVLDGIYGLVQVIVLHKGVVALDLHPLEPAKWLKQLLEVPLACAIHVKVDDEEGGGGRDVLTPPVLAALDLSISLVASLVHAAGSHNSWQCDGKLLCDILQLGRKMHMAEGCVCVWSRLHHS